MSQINVTTVVQLTTGSACVIQNLGPGILYVEVGSGVAEASSLQVPVGKSLSVAAGAGNMWGLSTTNSDVRVMVGATGLHG